MYFKPLSFANKNNKKDKTEKSMSNLSKVIENVSLQGQGKNCLISVNYAFSLIFVFKLNIQLQSINVVLTLNKYFLFRIRLNVAAVLQK